MNHWKTPLACCSGGHNFVEAEDVNLDGQVSAIDALVVINHLDRLSRDSANSDVPESAGDTTALRDVNDNGEVSSLDASRVINRLSRGNRSAEELESGIDQLADAILTENLPHGMRPQTAETWLDNLETRTDAPLQRRGAFTRLDANDDGDITEDEVREDPGQASRQRMQMKVVP